MTTNELIEMSDGQQWLLDQYRAIAAVAVSVVTSCWTENPPSVETLERAMGKRDGA